MLGDSANRHNLSSIKSRYYYLTYSPPKDAVQRGRIAKELALLEGVRLHSSLWKIPSQNVRHALKTASKNGPIVLKRTREILPPQVNFDKHIFDLGSVAIIAYRLPTTSPRKRAAVVRMLRRVPKIKIGSALLLIPYLKSSKLGSYRGRAVLQDELFSFLDREGVEAHRLTHLRIVYPSSHEELLRLIIIRETLACEKLASSIRSSTYAVKHADKPDLAKTQKLLSFYKSRYRDLQGVAFFMYSSMNVDLRLGLKKAYNALMHYRQAVGGKIEELSVAE